MFALGTLKFVLVALLMGVSSSYADTQMDTNGVHLSSLPETATIPSPRPDLTRMLLPDLTPMFTDGSPASKPLGHQIYCRLNKPDCTPRGQDAVIILDEYSLDQIIAVNTAIHWEIESIDDLKHFGVPEWWTLPINRSGDCEDIVLEKRRRLIALGAPVSAVLMATVDSFAQGDGADHVVLVVRTDRGDLVLDNLIGDVLPWQYLPHQYYSRQSPLHSGEWEVINDIREEGLFASLE